MSVMGGITFCLTALCFLGLLHSIVELLICTRPCASIPNNDLVVEPWFVLRTLVVGGESRDHPNEVVVRVPFLRCSQRGSRRGRCGACTRSPSTKGVDAGSAGTAIPVRPLLCPNLHQHCHDIFITTLATANVSSHCCHHCHDHHRHYHQCSALCCSTYLCPSPSSSRAFPAIRLQIFGVSAVLIIVCLLGT